MHLEKRTTFLLTGCLLLLSAALWLIFGPAKTVTEQAITQSRQVIYARFTLPHLKRDLGYYQGLTPASFGQYAKATQSGTYLVPDLDQAQMLKKTPAGYKAYTAEMMTPQGVAVTPDYVIVSAYDHQRQGNSILSIMDKRTGRHLKNIILKGRPHVGGITYDPEHDLLWVCGRKKARAQLFAIKLTTIGQYPADQPQKPIQYQYSTLLKSITRASLVSYHDGALWVGYFNIFGDSNVQSFQVSAVIKGREKAGVKLTARNIRSNELKSEQRWQVVDKIQGLTFSDTRAYFSQSYGLDDSWIYVFATTGRPQQFTPEKALLKIRMPAHLEQITLDGNPLYAVFESGAKAYALNAKTRIGRVVSFDIDTLVKEAKQNDDAKAQ